MGTKFIGYARVSTLDQNSQLQLDALKAAGCDKIFDEKASGAKEDRPQLSAALNYLRDGDTLVVWKLDRLARSVKQLIETVEQLTVRGIGFRSLTEAIDTTTASGELFFHIFGALAQFERSIIRERTNAGLKAALARGRKGGRRPKVKEDDIRVALALLNDPQISVRAAAKRLGLSVSSLSLSACAGAALTRRGERPGAHSSPDRWLYPIDCCITAVADARSPSGCARRWAISSSAPIRNVGIQLSG